MDEHTETLTSPPDNLEASPAMMDAIMKAIGELDIATHADFVGMNQRIDEQNARIETVESAIAELPAKFASAEDVRRIVSSQEEYELSRRTLTKQVADLANVQADIQPKFTSIEARLNDLSTMKGMLTTFMETQRERLDNHDARLNNADRLTRELSGEVRFVKTTQVDAEQRYNTGFKPVHDFIVGSETQKPMMAVIDNIQTAQTTQGQTLQTVADYVKAQQQKEADRLSFWRSVRLQMWTWRGVLSMILALLVFLIIVNSINFDQLFERIRQLADVIAGLLRSVKVS